MVKCLSGVHKVLSLMSTTHELGVVAHSCHARPCELEAGGPELKLILGLHSNLEANLGYMRLSQNTKARSKRTR